MGPLFEKQLFMAPLSLSRFVASLCAAKVGLCPKDPKGSGATFAIHSSILGSLHWEMEMLRQDLLYQLG